MNDLRTDRSHQNALDLVETAAPDNDEVRILSRIDDYRARITLAQDRLGVDAAFGQERSSLFKIPAAPLDLGWVQATALRDPGRDVRLGGCDDDKLVAIADHRSGAFQSALAVIRAVVADHVLHRILPEQRTDRLILTLKASNLRGAGLVRSDASACRVQRELVPAGGRG